MAAVRTGVKLNTDATFATLGLKALRAARAAFKSLGRQGQFLLAHEVVETREHELRLAYPDLVGIGFGFKSKRVESGRATRLIRTPCVVFEVKRKRQFTRAVGMGRKLPAFLYAYVGEAGSRRLCALPTDVKESAAYGKPAPHGDELDSDLPFGIVVRGLKPGVDGVGGTIACAVTRPSDPGRLYALSCRHVLGRSLEDDPDVASGCRVNVASMSGPFIGRTEKIRGTLLSTPAPSFDAQLLRVSDKDALRMALVGLRFDPNDPVLSGPEKAPNGFWVATPRSDANNRRLRIWITLIDWPKLRSMPYKFRSGELAIAHTMVMHGEARDERLKPGDSGSPAVLVKAGGMLIGMYLGGDGFHAYFIPGWQLLFPGNYGLNAGEAWRVADI